MRPYALMDRLRKLSRPEAPFVPDEEAFQRYQQTAACQETPYRAKKAAARLMETMYRTWLRTHCGEAAAPASREDPVGPYTTAHGRIVKQRVEVPGLFDLRLDLVAGSSYWYLPERQALCLMAAVRAQVYHAAEGQVMYLIPGDAFYPPEPGRAYE